MESAVSLPVMRYSLPPLTIALALVLRQPCRGLVHEDASLTLLVLAVLVAVRFAGAGPGALAAVLAVGASHFFPATPLELHSFTAPAQMTAVVLEGLLVIRLNQEIAAARGQAHTTAGLLRASEERYRVMVETAGEGIWLVGPTGKTEYVNLRMARMLGYEPREFVGRSPSRFLARLGPTDVEQICHPLAERHSCQSEMWFRRKDGSEMAALVSRSAVPNASGEPAGLLLMVADVTARKGAEEQCAKALRREQEARKDLEVALDEVYRASRQKDDFIATLGHELRNPLAATRTALELLDQPVASAEVRERALAVIDRQVRQQSRLVDDLLDVSRIARGKITLQREPLDLAAVVLDTLDDYQAAVDAAGLKVEFVAPEEPVRVKGDSARLAQVLGNLLQNAIKFSDAGGQITVTVGLNAARRRAEVTVKDEGAGMDPALIPALFEPFVQADHSLPRSKGGIGLGLSLARGLVELHEGRILAHSDGPGRGSLFTLWLPLTTAGPRQVESFPAPGPALAGLRVLIVEDNCDGAETLRDLLELAGHHVRIAYDGASGLDTALRGRFDVVLSDLGLPGVDGYELASALRREPGTRGLWLIAMSGYGSPEDRRRSRDAGFDCHLAKPLDPQELTALLAHGPERKAA